MSYELNLLELNAPQFVDNVFTKCKTWVYLFNIDWKSISKRALILIKTFKSLANSILVQT